MIKKSLIAATFMSLFGTSVFAAKPQVEDYYATIWCNQMGGILEVETSHGTRVDCLTEEYAVEVDFDNKWAEGLGQALHYGVEFNRTPAVLLILKNQDGWDRQKYIDRLYSTIVGANLNVKIFIIEAKNYPTRD